MSASQHQYDIIIAGAGMVGSTLALALARLPLRILVVDPAPLALPEKGQFDARVTALANGSQRILDTLGLWPELKDCAQPIETIHVSNRGSFGIARIRAADEGVPALGYTVENANLIAALALQHDRWDNVEWRHGARVADAANSGDHVAVNLKGKQPEHVTAALLVAADGSRSRLREIMGASIREHDYGQTAIVANCTTQRPHRAVAYERFTKDGPIALLPLPEGRSGIIWTLPSERAGQIGKLGEAEFKEVLQDTFGFRLGRIRRLGERQTFPLIASSARPVAAQRMLLIGNAANTLHPVAGQGFNLALRDLSILAELIAATPDDAGSERLLDQYLKWRRSDQTRVAMFTHHLIGLFGARRPGVGFGRNLGLLLFDLIPGAKHALARHTMGLGGRLPRLARGLPLDSRS